MLNFIMVPAIIGIVTYGIYSIFELFARKKERLSIIDKLGDKMGPELMEGKLKLNTLGRNPFGAMKAGALLVGLGLGLLVGFLIADYYQSDWDTRGLIYGASVMLCGGLGLLAAFGIEYRLSRKNEK